jgi:hypothetical protein
VDERQSQVLPEDEQCSEPSAAAERSCAVPDERAPVARQQPVAVELQAAPEAWRPVQEQP